MSESKHTPGPWLIMERDSGDNIFTEKQPHRRIANTYGDCEYGSYQANARLIAAAPDLLEACKAAMSVLSGGCSDDVERGAPSGAAMNMLAAAIRKAEKGT